MNTTAKSNSQHGHKAIDEAHEALVQAYRDAITVEIGSASIQDAFPDHQGEVELLPVGEFTIYPDTLTAVAEPAQEIQILTDIEQPEQTLTPRHIERIRDRAARMLAEGITEPKTVVLTGDTVTEFVGDRIKHPPFCTDDGKCFAGLANVQIEHASSRETFTAQKFDVEAVLEVITDQADYINDLQRLENPQISIGRKGVVPENIHGTPEEFRALGHFLIEQADRFQTMLDEAVEASL